MSALNEQVGGDHYRTMKIQPAEFIHANNIGFFEANVIKYVSRWRTKNGVSDLHKAKHYIDLLLALEHKKPEPLVGQACGNTSEPESEEQDNAVWVAYFGNGDARYLTLEEIKEIAERHGQGT